MDEDVKNVTSGYFKRRAEKELIAWAEHKENPRSDCAACLMEGLIPFPKGGIKIRP